MPAFLIHRRVLKRWWWRWWMQVTLHFSCWVYCSHSLGSSWPTGPSILKARPPLMVKNTNGRAKRLQSLWSLLQLFLSSPEPTRAGAPLLGGHSLPTSYVPLPKYLFTTSHTSTPKNRKESKPICISSMQTPGLGFCQNRSHITTNLKIMTKNGVQLLTQSPHKA